MQEKDQTDENERMIQLCLIKMGQKGARAEIAAPPWRAARMTGWGTRQRAHRLRQQKVIRERENRLALRSGDWRGVAAKRDLREHNHVAEQDEGCAGERLRRPLQVFEER